MTTGDIRSRLETSDRFLGHLGIGRLNQVLIVVALVQLVIAVIVFWPRPTGLASRAPLFEGLESDDVVALTLTADDGSSVHLSRVAGAWVLPEADDFPVLDTKVPTILDKLTSLTTGQPVAQTSESHRRLQVAPEDFVRKVEIESDDGDVRVLYVGSSPAYGATHIRADGSDATYLTNDLTTWELATKPNAWVETAYVDVPMEDIRMLRLQNMQGSLTLRQKDGVWTLDEIADGETLDQAQASSLARSIASIRLERPLGQNGQASYGLGSPLAVAVLETDEGTITLTVGAEDLDDDTYVVSSSASDYVVRVPGYSVKGLVEKTYAELLAEAESLTPEAGPSAVK